MHTGTSDTAVVVSCIKHYQIQQVTHFKEPPNPQTIIHVHLPIHLSAGHPVWAKRILNCDVNTHRIGMYSK